MTDPATSPVDAAIQKRQTTKVFADEPLDLTTDRETIHQLVAAAAWAPFHRPANKTHVRDTDGQSSLVPWRFYLLDTEACRAMRGKLLEAGDVGKLPNMLAAAECVIQATWLPDPAKPDFASANPDALFEPSIANMEHIAAAASAIQNVLIAATDRGLVSYWSSGGALRQEMAFESLSIPDEQILLGAIFLFPADEANTERVPGKLREKRGKQADWATWVQPKT